MDEQEQAIGNNELAIIVEMGDDFEPGSRTTAALQELAAALNEEHGDDVAGFNYEKPQALRNFSFMSAPDLTTQSFEAWPAKWVVSRIKGE